MGLSILRYKNEGLTLEDPYSRVVWPTPGPNGT